MSRGAKRFLDHCDRVLSRHYGFTEEHLRFIINYDTHYGIGRRAEGEDE